ncbi:hypothetical protein FACS189435_4840 [Bacteroidia bacterium]|nr:hypothetical protein FACS189435_4840 [Bacteroidia bacterium]
MTVYAFSFTATCSGTYTVLYAETNTFITVNPANVTCEVTFNPDNGSPPWTVNVNKGSTVNEPSPPTKDGYSFDGWYIGSNLFDFTRILNGDFTLTAHWTAHPVTTYTLAVVNGTGGGNYEAGASASISADIPQAGKQFKNWTSSNGGMFGNANSASTTFTMSANATTVIANYEDIPPAQYTLSEYLGEHSPFGTDVRQMDGRCFRRYQRKQCKHDLHNGERQRNGYGDLQSLAANVVKRCNIIWVVFGYSRPEPIHVRKKIN